MLVIANAELNMTWQLKDQNQI